MIQNALKRLHDTLDEIESKPTFARLEQRPRLLASLQPVLRTREGQRAMVAQMPRLEAVGLFTDTPWADPAQLVPRLVSATLRSGGGNAQFEILSELRLLSVFLGEHALPALDGRQARTFLEEVLALNLDLVFGAQTEDLRQLSGDDRERIDQLFALLLEELGFQGLKARLAEEVELLTAQRPIVTERVRGILARVRERLALDPAEEADARLQLFVDALYAPTPLAAAHPDPRAYGAALQEGELSEQCLALGERMHRTGLVSAHHAAAVLRVMEDPERLALALHLDSTGRVMMHRHHALVKELLERSVATTTPQAIYGIARLLDRGLLDRQPVVASLRRLMAVQLHPAVSQRILRTVDADAGRRPEDILVADTLRVLGLPLGVGQGGSPTCQSARGISLWSQHAPGKLLELVVTAAQTDDLTMRFEGALLNAAELLAGLAREVDYTLDAVSVVLVPHLDRIYNEMMRRAALRGDDPHRWVNPALYGHWIPTGFASAYDAISNSVPDFPGFARLFLAAHHPTHNGGFNLIYPNPVGLVVTSALGRMVGFHAVSLLRMALDPEGEVRAYFLNPNEEGRQDWGQGITPAVAGHGELPGESSLPAAQFASRLYAFHYNPGAMGDPAAVPEPLVAQIDDLARQSWGTSYHWAGVPAQDPGARLSL